jgi:hypothetical protein
MNVFIGYAVSVLGLILISVGVVGAALKVASEAQGKKGFFEVGKIDIVAALKAMPAVIEAILGSPTWLLCVLSGLGLVFAGFWLTGRNF